MLATAVCVYARRAPYACLSGKYDGKKRRRMCHRGSFSDDRNRLVRVHRLPAHCAPTMILIRPRKTKVPVLVTRALLNLASQARPSSR